MFHQAHILHALSCGLECGQDIVSLYEKAASDGITEAYKPLMRNLTKQMQSILDVYNPMRDYDFGVGESADNKLLSTLDNLSLDLETAPATQPVMPMYFTINEADHGLELAHQIAQTVRDKVRTE